MSLPLPERPRLANTVHARIHVVDGVEQVVLHEWRTGMIVSITRASFKILTFADGTRDLDALCLAAAREGLYEGEDDLIELLSSLNEVGLLEDGLLVPVPPSPVTPEEAPGGVPLEVLPDYALSCDGSGSCCRFYGGVIFSTLDMAHARVVAENLTLPVHPDHAFTPIHGAQEVGESAVAVVDGRCLFLSGQRCEIHAHAGATAKPFACRFYPTVLVYDGTAVRATPAPECVCIFESVGKSGGEPLVDDDIDLAEMGWAIKRVPDPVPLTMSTSASRESLRGWATTLADALRSTTVDAAELAFDLASRVEETGLSEEGLAASLASPRPLDETLAREWLEVLRDKAQAGAANHRSWRAASDLSRQVADWLAESLAQTPLLAAQDPAAERFYLRTLAYGHRLSQQSRPLGHALRDRGTRILAARAMAESEAAPRDSVSRYPLAMLEAATRNLGLSAYADRFLGLD